MKEYFSHDYYAREDEKIKNLLYAHKWTGYGIYWAIIEMLYQNDGYMQLHYNRIAFELRTEEELVDSIINDFELFKIKGDQFTSESVLRRLKMREEKSSVYKANALKRWNSVNKKDATAMQLHSNSNAIKEKKRKENKIFIIPTIEEIKQYCQERRNTVDANKFHNFYESKGWYIGKTKMKDWKAAVRTWEDGKDQKPKQKPNYRNPDELYK